MTIPNGYLSEDTLRVTAAAFADVLSYARAAGRRECMGLLAAPRDDLDAPVSAALLLPADAGPSRAEAEPIALRRAADDLFARRLRPAGLWHSHAGHDVFHSLTDDTTVARLLPGMAEWGYRRPAPVVRAPCATGPDTAALPLADGRLLAFTLLGAEVPDLDARERIAWAGVATRFRPGAAAPRATFDGRTLRLTGGGVRLVLGVPEGAALTSRVVDAASVRCATLHSLVVNNRGDAYAEALVVWDLDGRSVQQQRPVDIDVIAAEGSVEPPVGVNGEVKIP